MAFYKQFSTFAVLLLKYTNNMTATLTYTLVLAAIFFGKKAIHFIEEE